MEVFRQVEHVDVPVDGVKPVPVKPSKPVVAGSAKSRREYREFRAWIKDVKGMSRGWEGMWWGCGKDAVGASTQAVQ